MYAEAYVAYKQFHGTQHADDYYQLNEDFFNTDEFLEEDTLRDGYWRLGRASTADMERMGQPLLAQPRRRLSCSGRAQGHNDYWRDFIKDSSAQVSAPDGPIEENMLNEE